MALKSGFGIILRYCYRIPLVTGWYHFPKAWGKQNPLNLQSYSPPLGSVLVRLYRITTPTAPITFGAGGKTRLKSRIKL